MRHDPEANAATYLGGALSPRQARRFEAHLLECESCWQEVTLGRQGRSIMEGARELAPQSLREQVRMAVAGADHRHPRRIGLVVGGAALFVVLAVIGVLVFQHLPAGCHRPGTRRLPGRQAPSGLPPRPPGSRPLGDRLCARRIGRRRGRGHPGGCLRVPGCLRPARPDLPQLPAVPGGCGGTLVGSAGWPVDRGERRSGPSLRPGPPSSAGCLRRQQDHPGCRLVPGRAVNALDGQDRHYASQTQASAR